MISTHKKKALPNLKIKQEKTKIFKFKFRMLEYKRHERLDLREENPMTGDGIWRIQLLYPRDPPSFMLPPVLNTVLYETVSVVIPIPNTSNLAKRDNLKKKKFIYYFFIDINLYDLI